MMAGDAHDDKRESREQAVYRWVRETTYKLTAAELENRMVGHFGGSRTAARRTIRNLIAAGGLTYIYQYGQSYIDLGFRCPTPITPRVTLYPPECSASPSANALAIVLEPGAAFGDGRHPTTRLAMAGLERIWYPVGGGTPPVLQRGIDIGTGSGILAIAAARMGTARVDAVDIDPCALHEARKNVDRNHLGHRINLLREALENLEGTYDLILANLRLPTLCTLASWAGRHTPRPAYLVFSGFRDHEQSSLQEAYPETAFRLIWSETQAGWGGLVFEKF